ncbi:HIT-like domain-containing protein [Podospora australis]|uniref:Aprataxin-like protein n=1 Tax=Podospora australis TaxID=1536484 RepID=A0AAN7AIR1_9PEZI|nr:HIT-like domain-containing protein [Podospora australis]
MAETTEDPADLVDPSPSIPAPAPAPSSTKRKNAFEELMTPKPKLSNSARKSLAKEKRGRWSGALVEYINHPDRFPGQVLCVTPHTVLIKDSYPKATVHLLLLPRSEKHYLLRPHEAFADAEFLKIIREEAASAAKLAASELERLISPFSAKSKERNEAMDNGVPFDELPAGRDFLKEIKVGLHAHPSMDHLHVHILSRDMHSEKVKHKKHYNSFNTEFFVPLEDYPLGDEDRRRETQFQNENLGRDFRCWRCGREFPVGKFADLKRHLEEEFEEWKLE